ncbi:MAG: DUF2892 domain-containing protein [Candidatus Micrarchaeia archaeon]|jgi:hypothetical protein
MEMGERNVGDIDKAVRAALALVFIGSYVTGSVPMPWSYVLLLLGLLLVGTAAYGTCLVYSVLGISTCPGGYLKKRRAK